MAEDEATRPRQQRRWYCGRAESRDRQRAGWPIPAGRSTLATGAAVKGCRALDSGLGRGAQDGDRPTAGKGRGCRRYRRQTLHLTNPYRRFLTLILSESIPGTVA